MTDPTTPDPAADPGTRAGFVAIVGRPNAGKSTLLNALIGQKLSIVTAKAQTTWQRVAGIHTTPEVQAIFLDTPGLLEVRDLLQESMLEEAHEALRSADLVLIVADATEAPLRENHRQTIETALAEANAPRILIANKADRANRDQIDSVLLWGRDHLGAEVLPASALRGHGVEALREEIESRLPESPFLYPEDEIATEPVRFFVRELIRETVFEQYREEIPYSVFALIDDFREAQDPIYIGANLYVERNSQKGILIGNRGGAIKALGEAARAKIETFLERPVYLDLWVKVLPNWRRKPSELGYLGIRVPEEHAS